MPKARKTDRKRFERQEKRRIRNRAVRSIVKTYVTRARQSIVAATPVAETAEAVLHAVRQLDIAARKGVIPQEQCGTAKESANAPAKRAHPRLTLRFAKPVSSWPASNGGPSSFYWLPISTRDVEPATAWPAQLALRVPPQGARSLGAVLASRS